MARSKHMDMKPENDDADLLAEGLDEEVGADGGAEDEDEGDGIEGVTLPRTAPQRTVVMGPGMTPLGPGMVPAVPAARFATPRTASPPLWAGSAAQGATGKLRVQRVVNGHPHEIGELGVSATPNDLVDTWPVPGAYWITPVALDGRKLAEPIEYIIAEDHQRLQERRAAARAEAGTVGVVGMAPPPNPALDEALRLMKEIQARERAAVEAEKEALRKKEAAIEAERARLAQEKLDLTVINGDRASDMAARLMEKDASRAEAANQHLLAMFQADREAREAQFQRERELADAQRRRDREEFDRQMERDRQRIKAEREEWERREERRREDEERREERRRQEDREAKDREREWMLMVRREKEAANPLSHLSTLKEHGLIGKDEGWMEKAIELVTVLAQAKAAHDQAKAAHDQAQAMQLAAAQRKQIEAEEEDDEPDEPEVEQVQVVNHGPPPAVTERPLKDRIAAVAATHNMDQADIVTARRAVRDLVHKLRLGEEAQWKEIITGALLKVPTILTYATAVSIYWALVEGQADDAFASKVIAAIDASGSVPEFIPRKIDLPA